MYIFFDEVAVTTITSIQCTNILVQYSNKFMHSIVMYSFVLRRSQLSGLKITAGQRTMSGLIEALTSQTFDLPVMLTGQN